MTVERERELPRLDVHLSISIVTWNSKEDILACLDSLQAAADTLTLAVTVVDNASSDGTGETVRAGHPEVQVIQNTANVGFGAAHNQAMKAGVGRYHLVLNPDTVLMPLSLCSLVNFLKENSGVGLVGPKVHEKDGSIYPSFRAFPTPGALLFRNKLLARLFPHNPYTRHYLMGDRNPELSQPTDWISGSAILLSRPALESIGLLDERFFMYCEDMDWCRRAHEAGWQVYYHPEAVIIHLRARSTDRCIPKMIVEHHRSMWKYYQKHDAAVSPAWRNLATAAVLFLRASMVVGAYYGRRVMTRKLSTQRS